MNILSTHQAQQIDRTVHDTLHAEFLAENPGKHPHHLHTINPRFNPHFNVFFGGADTSLFDPNEGYAYYYAEINRERTWIVDKRDMKSLVHEIARFIQGTNLAMVTDHPQLQVGLPLWSLHALLEPDDLFPPHLIPVLNADFDNLESDGTAQEFLHHLKARYPDRHLDSLYMNLAIRTRMLCVGGGSFLFEP